jgi:hypothetical protein
MGKTTLLEALVERCAGAVTVARAFGPETETERAFSGLTELLYPVLRQRVPRGVQVIVDLSYRYRQDRGVSGRPVAERRRTPV